MSQFKQLQNVMNGMIQNLGIENQLLAAKAINYWPIVVGPRIAANAQADYVSEGKLFVRTTSDAWRNELTFFKQNLTKKLNEQIGKQVIFDIILL
jgi:predicted nucleic acid-binding Zn ribbon protein